MADTRLLIRLCRENAPTVYNDAILPKIHRFEMELNGLRKEYADETDELKRKDLQIRAEKIKQELEIYKS